jgi:hypothetical protein
MPLVRRRPLLRAAAVGGGAYMAGKHRAAAQEREMQQESPVEDRAYAEPPPAVPAPAPAPAASTGITPEAIEQLKQLGDLHDQGVLTDEEFSAQKSRLLGG